MQVLGSENLAQMFAQQLFFGPLEDFRHGGIEVHHPLILIRHQQAFPGVLGQEVDLLFGFNDGGDVPEGLEAADDLARRGR